MKSLNYREIQQRFTHIDGEIVRVDIANTADGRLTAEVVLRFYPYWEHPTFVDARARGLPWSVPAESQEGERDVTVRAVDPVSCSTTSQTSATDLWFATTSSALWQYEDAEDIVCNSPVDHADLCQRLLEGPLAYARRADLWAHVPPAAHYRVPYALPSLPASVFFPVREALAQMGVATFVAREPAAPPPLVLMGVDAGLRLVARDFTVEVPEFEHRPEWCRQR